MTPVKDQDDCESAWAFSAIAAFESAIAIKTGQLKTLSEQELVDCSADYHNSGCKGGTNTFALDYIIDKQIALDEDYPYTGKGQICSIKSERPRFELKARETISPLDVNGLIKAIEETPVSVAIEVQLDFIFYEEGVYTNYGECGKDLNYFLTMVGYKNEEGEDNQYFILKNMWAGDWGEEGYIRVEMGEGNGTCGIANDLDVIPKLRMIF